jgi:NDP-sugar pyrophosphorylase family protein
MAAGGLSAIILAGTYRWSDSSFEGLMARPLLPVALSPLISYTLRWLRGGGVRRVTICASHASLAVEAVLGDGAEFDLELSYYEDSTPRGAAGCVRDTGVRAGSETLLIADGATIPTVDLADLLASHRASGAAVTAVVHRDRSRSAPPSPGGAYLFERRVLDLIPEGGFQDIKENLIPRLHRAGERVVAYETEGYCPRVLNAQTYLAVSQWVLERLAADDSKHADDPLIHASAWVEPGARLVGPVQLGPGVRVRAGATVVGPTSLGAGSTVGRNALVARSVVWSRCQVGEGSVVHGCVVGNDAVVPPAARLFHAVHSQEPPKLGRFLAPMRRFGKAVASPAAHPGPLLR